MRIRQESHDNSRYISFERKIAVTIWFLSTGEKLRCLGQRFEIAELTMSCIIREVVDAIIKRFMNETIRLPDNDREICQVKQRVFVDGPAGSGKTYLYDCLLAYVQANSIIALAVASSSIASLLLHSGCTAHFHFKVPIPILVIWDEALMTNIFLFGGDSCQVLPVVHKGTRAQIVNAVLNKSYLWYYVCVFTLTANMQVAQATNFEAKAFAEYLFRIGNGTEPTIENNLIRFPDEMIVHPENDKDPIYLLINTVYPNLTKNDANITFVTERQYTCYSFDSVPEDNLNLYPVEYLNSLKPQDLPPHELTLKVGDHQGKHVFISRIPLLSSEDSGLPFVLQRKQFPVHPVFALTINKSQDQTIPHIGQYLPQPVFSHGQLYVAMPKA
nr:4908_t:CDS:2 [Entrophospora candida]CAG8561334.1 1102_t:CDS:2 [Entrophospora candida]